MIVKKVFKSLDVCHSNAPFWYFGMMAQMTKSIERCNGSINTSSQGVLMGSGILKSVTKEYQIVKAIAGENGSTAKFW